VLGHPAVRHGRRQEDQEAEPEVGGHPEQPGDGDAGDHRPAVPPRLGGGERVQGRGEGRHRETGQQRQRVAERAALAAQHRDRVGQQEQRQQGHREANQQEHHVGHAATLAREPDDPEEGQGDPGTPERPDQVHAGIQARRARAAAGEWRRPHIG
jgi:hypothetical protein